MIRAGLLGILSLMGVFGAGAQSSASDPVCDNACMFEAIWSETGRLDGQRKTRMEALFLRTVALTQDRMLIAHWERQLGQEALPIAVYEDYALNKVSRFITAEGWDAFFTRAQTRTYPLNSGRPEMMAAAAEYLADDATAKRIYALMESLGNQDRSEVAFERTSFGHALAEAAMRRCDLAGFDRALQMTDAPESIRYAFWRTRMTGHLGDLRSQIAADLGPENSAVLRQALDGYGAVLKHGTCAPSADWVSDAQH